MKVVILCGGKGTRLSEKTEEIPKGQTFNIGSSKQVSILRLVNKIIKLSERKTKLTILNQESNETNILNRTRTRNKFDWKLNYNLNSGLKKTIEWYENNYLKNCVSIPSDF